MMSDLVVSDEGPIRTLRMNRPGKKNALTLPMYETMATTIEEAATNGAIRCLLIAGGPEAFCAGHDIGDFMQAAITKVRSCSSRGEVALAMSGQVIPLGS